jgi:hypothetical protein
MALYGPGNLADDFRFYLEGPSRVSVNSIGELCHWLRGCQYHDDEVLFGRSDYWQHPAGFETLRRGDCEDHALWAWRKLLELGLEAQLVIGRNKWNDAADEGMHAWVVYTDRGSRILFEATEKSKKRMIRPFADVSHLYWPHVAVDHKLQRHVYAGFIGWLLTERQRRGPRKAARKATN